LIVSWRRDEKEGGKEGRKRGRRVEDVKKERRGREKGKMEDRQILQRRLHMIALISNRSMIKR